MKRIIQEELIAVPEGVVTSGISIVTNSDHNVVLSVVMEVLHQLRQLSKGGMVVREVQVLVHVINVIPLGVLESQKSSTIKISYYTTIMEYAR